MKRWTDETIAKLPIPKTGKKPTALGTGLYVITYSTGRRSFARIEKNDNGHNQARPFAPVATREPVEGAMTLAEARRWLAEHVVQSERQLAEDIAKASRDRLTITFAQLIADFLDKVIEPKNDIGADRKRRYRNTLENTFCKASVPDLDRLNWGSLRLADFKGKEWIQRYHNTLYAIERAGTMTGDKRGRCTLGNETDQFMQLVFDYAIELEYLAPAHRPKRNKSVRRPRAKTRYLTVAEIEHLLALTTPAAVEASAVMNELDACYLRVLLFTGTRLNSVRLAVRSNMHLRAKDFWTFPSEDLKETKTQREVAYDHHIPLTEPLRRELARLDAIPGVTAVDPFFPERYFKKRAPEAVKPVSNSWAKHLLGDLAEALGNDGADAYSGHAFRRTQSNLMRELGVPDHVINLCQARVARDTAKTYLTAELRDQVHNAFDVYHDFLEACTHGKGEEYLQYIRDQRRSGYLKERAARRDAIGLDRLGLVKGGAR